MCGRVAAAAILLAPVVSFAQLASKPPVLLDPVPIVTPSSGLPIPGGSPGQPGATGWEHTGVTLSSCSALLKNGRYELDGRQAPLVVDSCRLSGAPVYIWGNVTLRRSRLDNDLTVDCQSPVISIESGAGPVLIEDVEITTSNPNAVGGADRQDRTICVKKNNNLQVTLRRVWSHDTMRGLDITSQKNVRVEDSYLGPNVSPPIGGVPGSCQNSSERQHASAIRAAGGTSDISIINTVLHIGYCSWASGLIATYPEHGANTNWLIQGGLWIIETKNDGGYGIAAGYTPPESQNSNFTVRDLYISTQHYPQGCPSGCAQSWNEVAGTRVWTNVRKYNPGKSDHDQPIQ